MNELLYDQGEKQQNFITQFCKPVKILGKGAFSTVIEALNTMSNKRVAIKIIEKSQFNQGQLETLRREAQLLNQLSHPNIVRVTFSKETKNKIYIVMDLIEGVTLQKYQSHKLSEESVLLITRQLLSAIQYLHARDIIHRDIKPENILISTHPVINTTLIDFGLSAQLYLEGSGLMNDNCGTFLYMAPELIQKKNYNRSVDIWALGIVVFNMMSQGQHPFYSQSDDEQSYCEKIKWMKWNWAADIDDKIVNFLIRTVAYLPENRLTVNQCLQHPWISGNNSEPITFVELLKSHSIFTKIKQLILAVEFVQKMKAICPAREINKQIETSIFVKRPIGRNIAMSKSVERKPVEQDAKQVSNFDSCSSGSHRHNQFRILHTKRKERSSCDNVKPVKNVYKIAYKSLERSLKSLQTTNTTDNSLNQSSMLGKSIIKDEQFQSHIIKQLTRTNHLQRLPQQDLQISQRLRSSKPPLQKKSFADPQLNTQLCQQ